MIKTGLVLVIVGVCCRVSPMQAQIPVQDLQRVEGAWECADSDGVHGIFLTGTTQFAHPGGVPRKIAWQTINLLVYRRLNGQTQSGTFVAGHSDATGNGAVFDGKRLQIHLNRPLAGQSPPHLPSFDLDITFNSGRWTGAWTLCKKAGGAVLERPGTGGTLKRNDFVGDWMGEVETSPLLLSGSLHLRQSIDGTLTGWLEALGPESRNVSVVLLESNTGNSVVIRVGNGGYQFRYEAALSPDRKSLIGQWHNESSMGITTEINTPLSAPAIPSRYRRSN